MSEKTFDARLQHLRDTDANWTAYDPVVRDAEMILVDMDDGEICVKFGDGVTRYTRLPFFGKIPSAVLYDRIQLLTDEQKAQARANIGAASAEGEASYTNYADQTSSDWADDKRINSSKQEVSAAGVDMSNYIPISPTAAFIHVKGLDILSALPSGANYGRVYYYDASKAYLGYASPSAMPTHFSTASYDDTVTVVNYQTLGDAIKNSVTIANVAYVRLGGIPTASDIIITVDEDIVAKDGSSEHEERITDLENRVTALEKGESVPTYTNLFENHTVTLNYRVNSSQCRNASGTGVFLVENIDLSQYTAPRTLRIKVAPTLPSADGSSMTKFCFNAAPISDTTTQFKVVKPLNTIETNGLSDGYVEIAIDDISGGCQYMTVAIQMAYNTTAVTEDMIKDTVITINEEITTNSGSSDSDAEDITVVPEYWQTAVDEAITKVKALQDEGGNDVVNFVWFSDAHHHLEYIKNIGVLSKAVMDACDIPLALMNGDTLTAGVLSTDDEVISGLEETMNVFAPIGDERLMLVRGNHDDVYGWYHPTGSYVEGSSVAYVNKVAPEKIWNALHRPQATDTRRVFGGDGTYFYLDNTPQKVRFVCLNSCYYDGEAITDGTTKVMSGGFGTEQLDWLENVALAVNEGWGVVVAFHIPPISAYASQYVSEDYTRVRSIITTAADRMIAVFCGHMHRDIAYTDDLPCPIVVVTCAADSTYDSTEADRTAGTATETAIDIVSINRATKTIHTTRLGVGSDREVSYTGGEATTDYATAALVDLILAAIPAGEGVKF